MQCAPLPDSSFSAISLESLIVDEAYNPALQNAEVTTKLPPPPPAADDTLYQIFWDFNAHHPPPVKKFVLPKFFNFPVVHEKMRKYQVCGKESNLPLNLLQIEVQVVHHC